MRIQMREPNHFDSIMLTTAALDNLAIFLSLEYFLETQLRQVSLDTLTFGTIS